MSRHAIASVPASGWNVLIARSDEQGTVTYSIFPVVAFVVRSDRTVAPVTINPESLVSGEVSEAFPDTATGRETFRLLQPGVDDLSHSELASFERKALERYATFVANEQAKLRRAAYWQHVNAPEQIAARKLRNDSIIAATKLRLDRDQAARLAAEMFGDN
jgi:hypothetical protein